MKKLIVSAIAILLIASTIVNAQESTFNKGTKVINASIGIGSVLATGVGYSTKIPPISASFELGVKDNFLTDELSLGLGLYTGFSSYTWKWSVYNYGWNYTTFIVGGRAAVHYPLADKFDTYGGLMLGLRFNSSKEFGSNSGGITYSSTAGTGIVYSFYLGGRYYFTPRIAALGEIGYGISYLNLGLAFKL